MPHTIPNEQNEAFRKLDANEKQSLMDQLFIYAQSGETLTPEIIKAINSGQLNLEEVRKIKSVDHTALTAAAHYNNFTLVKFLVQHGAKVTACDNRALIDVVKTPVGGLGSTYNNFTLLKFLVSQGADISADNNCALNLAVAGGFLFSVKFLVESGTDITDNNFAAVALAIKNKRLGVLQYFESQVTIPDHIYKEAAAGMWSYLAPTLYVYLTCKGVNLASDAIEYYRDHEDNAERKTSNYSTAKNFFTKYSRLRWDGDVVIKQTLFKKTLAEIKLAEPTWTETGQRCLRVYREKKETVLLELLNKNAVRFLLNVAVARKQNNENNSKLPTLTEVNEHPGADDRFACAFALEQVNTNDNIDMKNLDLLLKWLAKYYHIYKNANLEVKPFVQSNLEEKSLQLAGTNPRNIAQTATQTLSKLPSSHKNSVLYAAQIKTLADDLVLWNTFECHEAYFEAITQPNKHSQKSSTLLAYRQAKSKSALTDAQLKVYTDLEPNLMAMVLALENQTKLADTHTSLRFRR